MKDDYAYSGWLSAGTGRVEGGAKMVQYDAVTS